MKFPLKYAIVITICSIGTIYARVEAPAPCGPVPTPNQLRWQEMEYYAFVHFSLNTYTDQSWGYGDEDVALFDPADLDCRQWARICKESGMKGIILTAKHHCGFSVWPSQYTEYSVKNSPWREGKGDLVKEMAEACQEYGLKLGIYLSPWDRNHPDYGKPEYITYFRNQLTELLTNYGPIFEVWFDGANGGSGYYGGANETRKIDRTTYYDWKNTYDLIRKLQPDIVIWNDGGDRADLRWVGTEEGYVGKTNWSLLNGKGDVPWEMLHHGLETGDSWVPAEVNTSIRPEWFYHPSEDDKVKTLPQLMDTYYHSIARNATLLLNFPITPNGLIHANDEKAALEFAKTVQETFAVNLAANAKIEATNVRGNAAEYTSMNVIDGNNGSYWATDDGVTTASLTIDLREPTRFNRFLVQESTRLGQRVKAFSIEVWVDGSWHEIAEATTIGYKRILRFPSVEARKVRFNIADSKCSPVIANIGIYNAPLLLNAPAINRNQSGEVLITTDDIGPIFYYTTNGSEPTTKSKLYRGPFLADGKVELKAIAYDPAANEVSPVEVETFAHSKKEWRIVGIVDEKTSATLDGDPSTVWHQNHDHGMPMDFVIDMGSEEILRGFKYLPDQNKWKRGVISTYQFYVCKDGEEWDLVDEGEFSNIQNNPVSQVKHFAPVTARYFKLRAIKNTAGNQEVGYAELDVITE